MAKTPSGHLQGRVGLGRGDQYDAHGYASQKRISQGSNVVAKRKTVTVPRKVPFKSQTLSLIHI